MTGSDFLRLDPRDAPSRGRTAWLTARIRAAVADATLGAGTRVPPSRELAEELSFSRGVVVEAYRRLTEEGLLVTNRGAGTRIAAAVPPAPRPRRLAEPLRPVEPLQISEGAPDLSAFPRAAWLQAERRVLTTATARDLGYADPQGVPTLREALAGWLARRRGIAVSPERIIVTAGVTGALSLIAQTMRERGATSCGIEDPSADGNRRIHISSLSKVLAPALRIGWMIAPEGWADDLVRRRWATDLGSPALPQLVLADLIGSGVLERQVRRLRLRHRQRRDAAVAAIHDHMPGCRVEGIAAGLHVQVMLPDGVDDADLAQRAASEGISVKPLADYRFSPGPPGLVIGYGPHSSARLTAAIAALGRLL